MNIYSKTLHSVVLGFSLFASGLACAEVAVIVNPATGVDSASKEEIARIFLGKSSNIKGATLTPIDQAEGNSIREEFYKKIANKTASQLNAYWSRLIFTGKGQPPEPVADDAEVVQTVSEEPGAIGYVDPAAVNSSVKVIFTAP